VQHGLAKKLTVKSNEKVREIARRGGAEMSLDSIHALDHGIEIGCGGTWLELTEDQYRKLLNP